MRNQDNFTMCYCSQPKSGINCCRYPISICETCERVMCYYHADTFGHLLTCKTPAEVRNQMKELGLFKGENEK